MESWYRNRVDAGFPVVVAVKGSRVAGYGSFGPFRSGQGYARTVEHSIYVADGFRGHGVGRLLLQELIDRARSGACRLMIGGISGGEEASLRFHRAMGFAEVGRIPGAGEKFGQRLDLVLMALDLEAG